ncbi:MAG: hypothetical protein H7338_24870 [Candidatus Sericytochromatia bacterium]|nr:hypothetical protein [Candidatus Sericytochromatia bacterium]
MLTRLWEDLRFVVGLLFGIFSVILLGVAAFGEVQVRDELHLNLVTGAVMAVFALIMLAMAFRGLTDVPQKS